MKAANGKRRGTLKSNKSIYSLISEQKKVSQDESKNRLDLLQSPENKNIWGNLFQLHMEWSNTVINTLEEFLKVAGFEIYDEEGEEIYLKVKSTNKIIKVRRDLFTKYITPNSSMDKEKPNKPDLDYNINVKSASMGLKEINPPKKICFKEKTEGKVVFYKGFSITNSKLPNRFF